VDFEGSLASGILEYGIATLHHGAVTEVRTRLCRPTGRVRAEDTALHGLSAPALAGCAPLADEWPLFAGLRETGPLAAHFSGAENALLKSVWPYPRAAPDFARPGQVSANWGPWVDTGRIGPQLFPQLGSAKLEEMIAAFGLGDELATHGVRYCPEGRRRYHAAPYDALAAALLLATWARDPQFAALSLPQLLALSTLDGAKRDDLTQGRWF